MDWYLKLIIFWIFVLGTADFLGRLTTVAAQVSSNKVSGKLSSAEEFQINDNNEELISSVDIHSKVEAETLDSKEQTNSLESDDSLFKAQRTSDGPVLSGDSVSDDQGNSSQVAITKDGDNSKSSNTTKSGRPTKVTCRQRNETENMLASVQVLNSSLLPSSFQTVPNATVAQCVLVLFYAPWCHFSATAAPHYNALPRLFPDISCVAVNAATYSSLNARYGTVAIPTLLLFHNGQPVAKFNESQYTLENFAAFVKKYTSLDPTGIVNVTSADFEGPLPSTPSEDTDYLLWIAWIFFVTCCCYGFVKSSLCHRIVEILRNNWQEAEAQHEHAE